MQGIRVPGGMEREAGLEDVFNEIIIENLLKMKRGL